MDDGKVYDDFLKLLKNQTIRQAVTVHKNNIMFPDVILI